MDAIVVFVCLLTNKPLLPGLEENILLNFEVRNKAARVSLQLNKRKQDVPMIFVYPFLELTGVNKLLSIKLRKTGTVFQLI